jgi:hypothetical protein
MIDFQLRDFIDALTNLNIAQTRARMADPREFPSDENLALIKENLQMIDQQAAALAMPTVRARLARVVMYFNFGAKASYDMLAHEIDEVFNAVERDARDELFCHYDKERVKFLTSLESDWGTVFRSFRSLT